VDNQQLKILSDKLDVIINLMGTQLIRDREYRDQVILLHNSGLDFATIAKLTGKTANNIKVTLHLIKKGAKSRKTKNE